MARARLRMNDMEQMMRRVIATARDQQTLQTGESHTARRPALPFGCRSETE